MSTDTIPADSTIATVWPLLTPQSKYVRGVLADMRRCRDKLGSALVRIGVTGTGQKPYYRIFSISEDGDQQVFGSFYDNREPLENGFAETSNWSVSAMTLSELEDFFCGADWLHRQTSTLNSSQSQ